MQCCSEGSEALLIFLQSVFPPFFRLKDLCCLSRHSLSIFFCCPSLRLSPSGDISISIFVLFRPRSGSCLRFPRFSCSFSAHSCLTHFPSVLWTYFPLKIWIFTIANLKKKSSLNSTFGLLGVTFYWLYPHPPGGLIFFCLFVYLVTCIWKLAILGNTLRCL